MRKNFPVVAPVALSLCLLASLPAQAEKFTSLHNHPDLKWYTIEGEHFDVHYPVSRRSKEKGNKHYINPEFAARKMAKVADEMWEPMCAEFNYYLNEKVHIVLLDQPDDLEGFTIPQWNWIEISANPGPTFYRSRGRMDWYSDVLVHEFAHVVSLKLNSAFGEGSQVILGGGLWSDGLNNQESGAELVIGDTDPWWWTEGGAEFWSDQAGYNYWTAGRDQTIRTTFLGDRVLTYDQWITVQQQHDWGDGERGYQQGYSFGLYIRQRFGDKAYAEFAKADDKAWSPNWERHVQKVTGVHLRDLYDDWRAYVMGHYEQVRSRVRAEGEVAGRELEGEIFPWDSADPGEIDKVQYNNKAWFTKKKKARDVHLARQASGVWDHYPRVSDDGKWIGESSGGALQVARLDEHLLTAASGDHPVRPENAADLRIFGEQTFTYPLGFGDSFDFVPGKDAVVVSVEEDAAERTPTGLRLERSGYNWKRLYYVPLQTREKHRKHHGERETYAVAKRKQPAEFHKPKMQEIPNTERGTNPAVSPDATRVAYHEYRDGTVNLVSIAVDGTDKKYLTNYADGTWIQGGDWSPDGKQLVFALFHNYQQDLYVVNADGSGLRALNQDKWEDMDPHWAKDGSVWFCSDRGGIFNIFRLDPASKKVEQMTNVLGGAEMPYLTPGGDLMYSQFTSHGWKSFVVAEDDLLVMDVTEDFVLDFDEQAVAEAVAYQEDLSSYADKTKRYSSFKNFMHPTAVPIFQLENQSRTNWGVQAGAQIFVMDYTEDHQALLYGLAGEDPLIQGLYTFAGWAPDITIGALHYRTKFDYAFMVDDDNNPETRDDQAIFEGKQHQYVSRGFLFVNYALNNHIRMSVNSQVLEYGFRQTGASHFDPYLRAVTGGVAFDIYASAAGLQYANPRSVNPRGHYINVSWDHGYTDIVFPSYNGYDTDDGEILDKYQYNRFEGRWSWHAPFPTFGIKALDFMKRRGHRLVMDVQGGFIDRNVTFQDEFRAGGKHPYFYGPGSLQPNTQFAGYPGFSLSGETMVIGHLGYRFPIAAWIKKKMGPLYVQSVWAQVGATAGNLWSFRPPDEEDVGTYYYDQYGSRVAYDRANVHRETPFVDTAYKNGNPILVDVVAEVRVATNLFSSQWNCFVRGAYGFQRIKGIGDVNGDDIQDTTETGLGDATSNEVEEPGPRLYIGLGTGW